MVGMVFLACAGGIGLLLANLNLKLPSWLPLVVFVGLGLLYLVCRYFDVGLENPLLGLPVRLRLRDRQRRIIAIKFLRADYQQRFIAALREKRDGDVGFFPGDSGKPHPSER